jgi:uncharacterized membrane protein (UPF0127 family)
VKRLLCMGMLAMGCSGGPGAQVAIEDVRVDPYAPPAAPQTLPRTPLRLPSGKVLSSEIARTPAERSVGMMFRTSLADDAAMLFVFNVESQLMFWMKNTFVNLDMIFIRADKSISVIHANVPKSTAQTPESALARRRGLAMYVLELPAGKAADYGLKPGDVLAFDD